MRHSTENALFLIFYSLDSDMTQKIVQLKGENLRFRLWSSLKTSLPTFKLHIGHYGPKAASFLQILYFIETNLELDESIASEDFSFFFLF